MNTLVHSWFMMVRHLMHFARQPWYIAFTLLQPIIWLALYGQLFRQVVDLPGFRASSYIDFLTPGVVIMAALFSSGWTGMGIILDLDKGVMDRLLVSPVRRAAIILGRLMNVAVMTIVQSLILLALGAILGARYPGGVAGSAVLLFSAIVLAVAFGALSVALALVMRKEESVIGAVNFVLLPLTFVSPVFMASPLMPGWMRTVARFNPVNWSVEAGRAALDGYADWSAVSLRLIALIVFSLVGTWLATRAFRSYQRSI